MRYFYCYEIYYKLQRCYFIISCWVSPNLQVTDLSEPIKDKFQIIGNTGGKQTYLDAIIAKNRHDRYTTIDNENPFLMEIRKI